MRDLIYTITPNPALDLGGTVERLVINEKNYVSNENRAPGGNGINVARVAHQLGAPVLATGFLGGPVGEEIKCLLSEDKVSHRFISTEGSTRINVTISLKHSSAQTRVSFPGPEIRPKEFHQLERWIERWPRNSLVVIGGSLPQGMTSDQIITLVKRLKRKRCHCVVDAPGPVMRKILVCEPFFIKPNLLEFQEMVGKKVRSLQAIRAAAQDLAKTISLVCVSSVEGGALLATKNEAWFGRIPPIKVRSTVGAGDSMVGAIVTKLWLQKAHRMAESDLQSALDQELGTLLRWGLASACATLVQPGTTLGNKKLIHSFLPKISLMHLPK